MYFFQDPVEAQFDPVIVLGLVFGAAALLLGVRERRMLFVEPRSSPGYQVVRLDLASAAILWGFAQFSAGAGWLLRLEGIRLPAWSYVSLILGAVILAIAWHKLRGEWSTQDKAVEIRPVPGRSPRLVRSATWDPAALGAGLLALLTYVLTMDHPYPHAVHWFTSGLAAVTGFAVGLAIWTRPMVTVVPGHGGTGSERRNGRRARRNPH